MARDAEKPSLKPKGPFVLVSAFQYTDPCLLEYILGRGAIPCEQHQISKQSPPVFLDQAAYKDCVPALEAACDLLVRQFPLSLVLHHTSLPGQRFTPDLMRLF
jgi:hypothetical protein